MRKFRLPVVVAALAMAFTFNVADAANLKKGKKVFKKCKACHTLKPGGKTRSDRI